MPKLAAAYIRCSTDLQDGSLPQQKKEILDWAASNDFEVVRWYEDEGRSGTSFEKRPGFSQLIRDIEHHPEFSTVLVYDESRWSRTDPRRSFYWKEHCKRQGVPVKVINSRAGDGEGLLGWLVEGMESEESGEYSRKLSRATFRGQSDNAGKGYSCGGMAPYGYKRIAVDPKTDEFIRDLPPGTRRRQHEEKVVYALGENDHVEIVQRIFRLYVDGNGLRAIADILNKENVPCPKGGRWRNKNRRWSSGTIRTILRNPVYYGARVFNKHPQSHLKGPKKTAWENLPDKWVVKENAHPAIIPKELWEKANTHIKPYERRNRFHVNSAYLLSGLIVCGRCGFKYHGITKRVKAKNYSAGYYIDSAYHTKGPSVCQLFQVRQDEVEGKVIGAISEIIERKEFLQEITTAVDRRLQERRKRLVTEEEILKKLAINRKAQEGFFELIAGGTEVEELTERIKLLEMEKKQLEGQLQSYRAVGEEKAGSLMLQVKSLVKDFKTTFSKAEPHIQKALIRRFVEKITVDPTTSKITIYLKKIPNGNGRLNEQLHGGHRSVTLKLNGKAKKVA